MRYDEFRDRLQIALQNVGLLGQRIGDPIETVDLHSMGGAGRSTFLEDQKPKRSHFMLRRRLHSIGIPLIRPVLTHARKTCSQNCWAELKIL